MMTAIPYCGIAPVPTELLARWNLDPVLLLALAGVAFLVFRSPGDSRALAFRGAAFAIALFLFVSPFCALTSALFAARSAHHVGLTAVLAPLVALGLSRADLHRLPGGLAAWTAAATIALWLWHAPSLYAAALSSDWLYWVMQLSLLATATGFWIAVRRTLATAAVAALLVYMVQMGLLAALLTFAPTAFYAPHFFTTVPWGLSPLEDQQLAGLIMWVPGSAVYLLAALVRLRRLLGEDRSPVAA